MADSPTFSQQDEQPTPIMPVPPPGPAIRRGRRLRHLAMLWTAVALLLLVQLAVALQQRWRRRGAEPPKIASVVTPAARADAAVRRGEERSDAGPASAPASRVSTTAARIHVASTRPRPRGPRALKRSPAKRVHEATPAPKAALALPSGPVSDVTVPAGLSGDADKGERLFGMGCGLCHGSTAAAISPRRLSARQWSLFFARGSHAQYKQLRAHFTRAELADVKAYLISAAGGK
jgi:mono/diheme cytochrome c family protein